ncbi:MAG: ATP-binding protein [Thermoleophilia bacterium]|nr:ATP-binding protein [Thermoleophilia bacterium]
MMSTDPQTVTSQEGENQPISLVIPGRAEYVGLCRLVAGVVGAKESLDEETVADLKLAVTEACTCYLWGPDGSPPLRSGAEIPPAPRFIRVDFSVMPEAWEIVVSDPDHQHHMSPSMSCDPQTQSGLGMTIIKALVDTMEHTDNEDEGCVLRLVKRLGLRSDSVV